MIYKILFTKFYLQKYVISIHTDTITNIDSDSDSDTNVIDVVDAYAYTGSIADATEVINAFVNAIASLHTEVNAFSYACEVSNTDADA